MNRACLTVTIVTTRSECGLCSLNPFHDRVVPNN